MTSPRTPGARLVWTLKRASQALESEKADRLRPAGLQVSHYSMLITIHGTPGMNGAGLARSLGVTPQNVASLASRLEARGLLERRTHSRHGHVQEFYLTTKGTTVVRSADRMVKKLEADIVQLLGADDHATLARILERVVGSAPELGTGT